MKEELTIRVAKPEDAKGLLEIYAPYVEKTAITFEYGVPSEKEFAGRIRHILTKYPYLVLEENGELLGYVYAGTFNERSAYDWAVETTIYIREDQKKRGLGKKMYTALEQVLKKQNITNLNACIGVPEVPDEHLVDGENNRRTSEKTAGDDHVSGTFKERSDTMGSIKSEK